MTINQIKKVALIQFTEKGYEGTSLSDIAQEVGIKKQSIYSHFKNKDELFLTVTHQAINEEIEFLHDFFIQKKPDLKDCLKSFIVQIKERYTQTGGSNIEFLLRIAYMPPLHLKDQVIKNVNQYFFELEDLVNKSFSNEIDQSVKVNNATLSFMTMLDGLFVALIYGGMERFEQKFKASWNIYWQGLQHS